MEHPPIEQAAKAQLNDDDIYIAQYESMRGWKIVRNLGCRGGSAAAARSGAHPVQVGQALLTGMTLKHLPLWGGV